MDKIYPFPCPPESSSAASSSSTTASTSSGGASAQPPKSDGSDYLRHLNKISHKISKPPLKKPPFDPPLDDPPPLPLPLPPQQNPHQHQPPVYNINKNDFRDVVQKLTGSPAHDRAPTPPPPTVPSPKLPSSRLQRIRPPPLSHLHTRPPPQLNCAAAASLLDPSAITSLNLNPNPYPAFFPNNFNFTIGRPSAILSPLPPLPSVHGAAESPVSAYMRHLNTNAISAMDFKGDPFLGFRPSLSPRWSNLSLPPLPGQVPQRPPEGILPSLQQQQLPVLSPMPFGCSTSPKSPYGLISPGYLFSPTSLGFPRSPSAVPVPSPRSGGA